MRRGKIIKWLWLIAAAILFGESCPGFEEHIQAGFRVGDKVILEKTKFDTLRFCYPGLIANSEIKEIVNDENREVAVFTLRKQGVSQGLASQEEQSLQVDPETEISLVFEEEKVRLFFKNMDRLEEIPSSEGLLLRVKGEINLKRDVYFSPTFSMPVKLLKIWEEKSFLYFFAVPDCAKLDFLVSGFELILYCKN